MVDATLEVFDAALRAGQDVVKDRRPTAVLYDFRNAPSGDLAHLAQRLDAAVRHARDGVAAVTDQLAKQGEREKIALAALFFENDLSERHRGEIGTTFVVGDLDLFTASDQSRDIVERDVAARSRVVKLPI